MDLPGLRLSDLVGLDLFWGYRRILFFLGLASFIRFVGFRLRFLLDFPGPCKILVKPRIL